MLKMWLNSKDIEFKEVNIEEDKDAYNKVVVEAGKKTVPVLEIEDEYVEHEIYNDILEYLK